MTMRTEVCLYMNSCTIQKNNDMLTLIFLMLGVWDSGCASFPDDTTEGQSATVSTCRESNVQ